MNLFQIIFLLLSKISFFTFSYFFLYFTYSNSIIIIILIRNSINYCNFPALFPYELHRNSVDSALFDLDLVCFSFDIPEVFALRVDDEFGRVLPGLLDEDTFVGLDELEFLL